MTWFADMTRYSYMSAEQDDTPALNVGWLAKNHDYPEGTVGGALTHDLFVRRLQVMTKTTVRLCMGLHQCDLCEENGPFGNGEIRVFTADRATTYAAPTLVAHYVEAHRYRPPNDFVDAVFAGRVEVREPHEEGDRIARYADREPLDGAHQAIACEVVAALAEVPLEVVLNNISFFIDLVSVCEVAGGWNERDGALPRMWVGWSMDGSHHIWNPAGPWDGRAQTLREIARSSFGTYTLNKLRERSTNS